MNITRDGRGGYSADHTFKMGEGSELTIRGRLSAADAERLLRFAKRVRALTTAGNPDTGASFLDQAAQYAGMAKGILNTPVGQAAAAIIPYGGLIKGAAEGGADALAALQRSGVAKDPRTAQRVARLHDPRYAAQTEQEVRALRAKATKGDKRSQNELRSLRNAMYKHLRTQLAEATESNRLLREALAEYGDPLAYQYTTAGEAPNTATHVAELHLFADQAMARSRALPQPSFRRR